MSTAYNCVCDTPDLSFLTLIRSSVQTSVEISKGVSSKIDNLLSIISQLLRMQHQILIADRKSDDSEPSYMKDWVDNAEKLLVSFNSIINSNGETTPQTEETSDEKIQQVQQFIHDRGDDHKGKTRVRSDAGGIDSKSGSVFDPGLVEHLIKGARETFTAENYPAAKLCLDKLVEISEEFYLINFGWRDEALRMLVCACFKLRKWKEAEQHLDKQFDGRDELVCDLAMEFLVHGKRDEATKICLSKSFPQRNEVLQLLATSYFQDKKWSRAEKILSELVLERAEEIVQLKRMHYLAEVYLGLNDLKGAHEWCRRAVQGRRKLFGEDHVLYHESVNLAVQICEKRCDVIEAEYYKEKLPSDSPGMQSFQEDD